MPNHFHRPVQNDRTHHEYGHTRLQRTRPLTNWGLILRLVIFYGCLAGLLIAGVLAIAAASTPRF